MYKDSLFCFVMDILSGQVKYSITAISAYFLRGWKCVPWVYCIRLRLVHEFAVEWLSLKETGADAQDNQLTAEENHDCCSLHETLETLTNSWRRRRSGRPEVKMHYWRLLRMRKTKLESSFRSGRLATRVSEVVFGRWVFIHFFAFCRTCRGSTITFQYFWWFFEIKDIFLIVVDEIAAC